MLDYRIETFLVLCECGSYRQTAEQLHITQPAVTQQIHHLEQEYGCKLFRYANRRLEKTEAAETLELYARAERLHEHALREQLKKKDPVKKLRIGATKTIGDYFLVDYIHRYLRGENHSLDFLVDNTEHLLRELEENRLDFAVVEGFLTRTALTAFCCAGSPSSASAAATTPSQDAKSPSRSSLARPSSTVRTAPARARSSSRS